jgi:hypothetical protein
VKTGCNGDDGLLQLIFAGRMVEIMVVMICRNSLCGGRVVGVMVVMVCWS